MCRLPTVAIRFGNSLIHKNSTSPQSYSAFYCNLLLVSFLVSGQAPLQARKQWQNTFGNQLLRNIFSLVGGDHHNKVKIFNQ